MRSALQSLKPLAFTRFCAQVLQHVTLTPGQRVLCLVAYDGVDPRDLTGEDRDLARQIFGDVDVIPPESRAVVVAVCGARGGKSYILCGLRLLHLALTAHMLALRLSQEEKTALDAIVRKRAARLADEGAAVTASSVIRGLIRQAAQAEGIDLASDTAKRKPKA